MPGLEVNVDCSVITRGKVQGMVLQRATAAAGHGTFYAWDYSYLVH